MTDHISLLKNCVIILYYPDLICRQKASISIGQLFGGSVCTVFNMVDRALRLNIDRTENNIHRFMNAAIRFDKKAAMDVRESVLNTLTKIKE